MILPNFIALQANVEQIKEKIETAPDKGYEIGVAIGTFLPLLVLVALAYWMYKSMKNRKDL
jgi:hypothetical protein